MTVHDISVLDRPELLPTRASRWYWSEWLAWVAQRADVLVTPSRFTAERLIQRLGIPARRIVALPFPPREIFVPVPAKGQRALRFSLNLVEPFCLGIGALEPRKDWEGLLAAFSRVAQRAPHRLILAGPVNVPEHRQRLEACIHRLGLEQRVRWLGYVPLPWLPVLYSAADLLIFPETYAGYGLPLLEAMACGTPVVTYSNTALTETAAGAALFLPPPYSPEVLAEMVLHLLQDASLRAEMSRRGLARVRQLSWEETTDCLTVVYASAGQRHKRRGEPPAAQRAAGAGDA